MREKKLITLGFPIVFLVVAIFINGLPYGFYTLLRFVIFISALYHVWLIKEENKYILSAIFIFIAILFNPIIPIELTREIWIRIDIVILIFFFIVSLTQYLPECKKLFGKFKINSNTISLFIILICLIFILVFRWEITWRDPYSYHRDLITSFVFVKLNGQIVGKATLPQNALLISNAVTIALYLSIGATFVGLLRGVIKK